MPDPAPPPSGGSPDLPPRPASDLDVDLAIVVEEECWNDALPDAERLIRIAALAALEASQDRLPPSALNGLGTELSVVLANDAVVQALNRDYRGKDKPTNVLSFALTEGEEMPGSGEGPTALGDIVLALETIAREAAEQSKPLHDHTMHLVVHGVLHLLGWDHLEEAEAEEMEARETQILAGLGVSNPYSLPFSLDDTDEEDDEPRSQ